MQNVIFLKKLPWALLIVLVLAAGLSSCGGKKAGLQSRAVLPDKTLFENGIGFLSKGQYIKARLSFQTLINAYEESDYLERSKYYIAYSYFKEGGVENLIQAEQAFKDFKLFFPTSALADDAQAYIVQINMHMIRSANRDLTYTQRAQVEVRNFLQEFPDSSLNQEMQVRLACVEDILATSVFLKGHFYYKKKAYKASVARFRECVQRFRNFGRRDQVLFLLADSLDHLKNPDESAIFYGQVVRGYPFSSYFEEAKDRLRKLEKPIPEVDTKLAEENKKNWYEGESIFTTSFRSIFGIVGIGDEEKPWEAMEKQRAEEEKARIKTFLPDKNNSGNDSKGM